VTPTPRLFRAAPPPFAIVCFGRSLKLSLRCALVARCRPRGVATVVRARGQLGGRRQLSAVSFQRSAEKSEL